MAKTRTSPLRIYHCRHCGQFQRRASNRQWIKSYCDRTDRVVHLMLVRNAKEWARLEYGVPDKDTPEWTAEDFARARPLKEGRPAIYRALMAAQARRRRRTRRALANAEDRHDVRAARAALKGTRPPHPLAGTEEDPRPLREHVAV